MSLVESLIDRLFGREGSMLCIGGVSAERLADRLGTPLFVYDAEIMRASLARLRAALPERFDVYYSIKANPHPRILRVFLDQGCGLEVASGGELQTALQAGADAQRVLFAGPGKTQVELEVAVRSRIGEIHVESLDEIDTLAAVARSERAQVGVAIRVNPSAEAQGGAMRMGGKPSQFGVDEERLESALDRVLASPELTWRGLHLFVGTQILDPEVLARQYAHGLEIAERAAAHAERSVATIDFGGGLGIPYYEGDRPLDVEAYGRAVQALLQAKPALAGARLLLEPGRHLVGESGVYVCRVIRVKESRGKTFVVTDGGMHHHLAASGNLGQVIKRNFPIAVLNRQNEARTLRADVVGPLCTPLDTLARDVELPMVRPGDLIGVFQSGAYARSASPLGFLSHPTPTEFLVDRGSIEVIRLPAQPD
jgi:diaminopimelate decarboxylase